VGGAFSQGGKKFAAQISLLLNSSYVFGEKALLYKKRVHKMLMKLTPGRLCSWTNPIAWSISCMAIPVCKQPFPEFSKFFVENIS